MYTSIKRIALIGGRAMGKTTLLTRLLKYTEVELNNNLSLSVNNAGSRKVLAIKNASLKKDGEVGATRFEDVVDLSYTITNKDGVKWIIEFKDYPGELFEKFLDHESLTSEDFDKISADVAKKFVKYLNGCDASIVLLPAEIYSECKDKGVLEIYRGAIVNCLTEINKRYGVKIPVSFAISKWDRCIESDFDSYIEKLPYSDFVSALKKVSGDNFLAFPISSFGKDYRESNPDSMGLPYNVLEMLVAVCEKSDETILQKAEAEPTVRKILLSNLRTFIIESYLKRKVSIATIADKIKAIRKPYAKRILVNFAYFASATLILAFSIGLYQQNMKKSELIDELKAKTNYKLAGCFTKQNDFKEFQYKIDANLYNFSNYGIRGWKVLDCYTPIITKLKECESKFVKEKIEAFEDSLEKLNDAPKCDYKTRSSLADERKKLIEDYKNKKIFIGDSYKKDDGKVYLSEKIAEIKKFKEKLAKYDPWEKAYAKLPSEESDEYLISVNGFLHTRDGMGKEYADKAEYEDKESEIELLNAKYNTRRKNIINRANKQLTEIKDIDDADKIKFDLRVKNLNSSKKILDKTLSALPDSDKDKDREEYKKNLEAIKDTLNHLNNNREFYTAYESLDKEDWIQINTFLSKYEKVYEQTDLVPPKYIKLLNEKKYKHWKQEYDKLVASEDAYYARKSDEFKKEFSLSIYNEKVSEYKSIEEKIKNVEKKFGDKITNGMPKLDDKKTFKDRYDIFIKQQAHISQYESKFTAKGWEKYLAKISELNKNISNLEKYVTLEDKYNEIKKNLNSEEILIYIDEFFSKFKRADYPYAISYFYEIDDEKEKKAGSIKKEIDKIDISKIPDENKYDDVISFANEKNSSVGKLLKRLPDSYKYEKDKLREISTRLSLELSLANILKSNKEEHKEDNIALLNQLVLLLDNNDNEFNTRLNNRILNTKSSIESKIRSELGNVNTPKEIENLASKVEIYNKYVLAIKGPEYFCKDLESQRDILNKKKETLIRTEEFETDIGKYKHLSQNINIVKKIEELGAIVGKYSDFELKKSEIERYKQELEIMKSKVECDKVTKEANDLLGKMPAAGDKSVLRKYREKLSGCKNKADGCRITGIIQKLADKITEVDDMIGSVTIEDIEKALNEFMLNSNEKNEQALVEKIKSFDPKNYESQKGNFEDLKQKFENYKVAKKNLLDGYEKFIKEEDKKSFDDFYRAVTNHDLANDSTCTNYLDWAREVKRFIENNGKISVSLCAIDFSQGNFHSSWFSTVDLYLEINGAVFQDGSSKNRLESEKWNGNRSIGVIHTSDLISVCFKNLRGGNSYEAHSRLSIYKLVVEAREKGNDTLTFTDYNIDGYPSITLEFSGLPTIGGDL